MENEKADRIYTIDFLRVIALLMVLSVHIKGKLIECPQIIINIMGIGAYGVALYFIISGYLGYNSVYKSKSVKQYFIKKAFHILPVYYFSLILTILYNCLVFNQPFSIQWIKYIFFVNMIIPSDNFQWWNSVNFYWTMTSFVLFYIFSPIIFRIIINRKRALGLVFLSVVSTPFIKMVLINSFSWADKMDLFVNWNFFSLFYCFALGIYIFFVCKEKCYVKSYVELLIIIISGLIIGNRSGFLIFGVLFSYFIIFLQQIKFKIKSPLTINIIKWISSVSYSTYLIHYFVLEAFNRFLNKNINWLAIYIIFIVISLAFGYLVKLIVEKPFNKIYINFFS